MPLDLWATFNLHQVYLLRYFWGVGEVKGFIFKSLMGYLKVKIPAWSCGAQKIFYFLFTWISYDGRRCWGQLQETFHGDTDIRKNSFLLFFRDILWNLGEMGGTKRDWFCGPEFQQWRSKRLGIHLPSPPCSIYKTCSLLGKTGQSGKWLSHVTTSWNRLKWKTK